MFDAGHQDWVKTYPKIPNFIDQSLSSGGGTRLIERGAGDFYGTFGAWKDALFRTLRKETSEQNVISEERLAIELVNSSRSLGRTSVVGLVLANQIVVSFSKTSPTIRHLEIKLPKGQTCRPGDYLSVLPSNSMEIVYRVLQRFHLSMDTHLKIVSSTETFFSTNHPVSAFDILSGDVELAQPISVKQLETLATLFTVDRAKARNFVNSLEKRTRKRFSNRLPRAP